MSKITRLQRIAQIEDEIHRHKAYGDTVAIDVCCRELEELESMTDDEYVVVKSLRKAYMAGSVKPFVPKELKHG